MATEAHSSGGESVGERDGKQVVTAGNFPRFRC